VSIAIQSKLPDVGTTIFTVMSQLAIQHNAINLGQGFPDYSMSPQLVELVCKAMNDGHNQYTHMAGLPLLREKLAEKIFNLYGTQFSGDENITVTPGGTYAIYTALTSILQKGDEVIVFEPAYDSYIPNIEVNGAVPVIVQLQYPGFSIPWGEVKSKITARTKAIIINSPHNPTGSVINQHDVEQLRSVVEGTDIFIISDEVYEHLVFDNLPHQSMLRFADLLQRSFVCFSFGKTYNCTGWKLGYCVAPASATKEFRKVHQFNCFSCFTPAQVAIAEYLKNSQAYLQMNAFMQQKRDFFATLMQQTAFEPIQSNGSYFQCYSYKNISNLSDTDFAMQLIKHYGVVTIPVSAFYKNGKDDKLVRFCFAKKQETLQKAANKLTGIGYQDRLING